MIYYFFVLLIFDDLIELSDGNAVSTSQPIENVFTCLQFLLLGEPVWAFRPNEGDYDRNNKHGGYYKESFTPVHIVGEKMDQEDSQNKK